MTSRRAGKGGRRWFGAVVFVAALWLPSLFPPVKAQGQGPALDYTIQQFADGAWYTGIHLADMDDDGQPELLIGNRDTSSVEIWRYDAEQHTLVQIDSIPFPYHVHDIRAADFDSDGDMDIVVGLRFEGVYYATNTGAPGTVGNWSTALLDWNYSWQVLVEDFDGDGNLDIFDCVDYGPIFTFYGDGAGQFTPGVAVEDPATAMRTPLGFNAVDLNGDDLLDLIGIDGSFMRAFLNPGNPNRRWASVGPDTPVGDYPCCEVNQIQAGIAPSAADLDGNGTVDQVAVLGTPQYSGPLQVLVFDGSVDGRTLQWTPRVVDTLAAIVWAHHAGTADLNGDGYQDIHLGGLDFFNGLYAYLGDGSGGFTPQFIPLDHGVGGFNSLAVVDLDQNGHADIITNRYTGDHGYQSGFEVLFGSGRNPPQTNADSYVTRQNVMLRVPAPGVLANDHDADGDPLTAILVTKPTHGWLSLDADGAFVYFPDYGYTGEDSFTYLARDGVQESAATPVSLYVWPNPYLARLMAIFR